jgi:HSP20 family protein
MATFCQRRIVLVETQRRCEMGAAKDLKQVPVSSAPSEKSKSAVGPARRAMSPFEEMDRLFSRMMGRPFGAGLMDPFRAEWPSLQMELPRVDVIDRDKEVVIRAEIPGVARENLDVTMSENSITFRGSTRHEEEKEEGEYRYHETSRGEFCRTIPLPADVDRDKARAKHKDGIVELVLPKVKTSQRRKVEVEKG